MILKHNNREYILCFKGITKCSLLDMKKQDEQAYCQHHMSCMFPDCECDYGQRNADNYFFKGDSPS